jgi:hypothetical protein
MTIDEAIDILSDNYVFTHACETSEEEQGQALDMAIRSLEAWKGVKADTAKLETNPDIETSFWAGFYGVIGIINKHLKGVEEL